MTVPAGSVTLPGPMRNALIPAGLALVVALAWAPILELPFTGEDFVILSRMKLGEAGSPHVFRPANDGWLWFLHTLFGVSSSAPYHAASLFLHLFATLLVFIAASELFANKSVALVAAALFGLGAGCVDSLAWIAAVNRLLSGVGALIALVGVLRVPTRGASALALVVAGLGLQLLSNEEVYGMSLFVLGALGWELRSHSSTLR